MRPRFTVLLPVNRPPHLLPFAIDSVLSQSLQEFQIFVVCDGAPAETVALAQARAKLDPRIRVFAFEKGERQGEAYRHAVLAQAEAPFVAQIGDDDIWFPNHLASLDRLLQRVDFGNLLQAELSAQGDIYVPAADLADAATRLRMRKETWNFFGPTVAGYRLSAYRRLLVGWSPAPTNVWADLHMWRKFLEREDFSFGTDFVVSCVKLSASSRQEMSLADRGAENAAVANLYQCSAEREKFVARAFKQLWQRMADDHARAVRKIEMLRLPRWKITRPLRWIRRAIGSIQSKRR